MRRILTVTPLSLLCFSIQAQLISFDTFKDGVFKVSEINKELIINGFTKVKASTDADTDTYTYDYDETEERASIWVNITPLIEFENAELYSIDILTSGDYIHDELVEEITKNCTFEGPRVGDEFVYTCDYTTFVVSSQGGNRVISAFPNFEQLAEDMTDEALEEFMKVIANRNEEK